MGSGLGNKKVLPVLLLLGILAKIQRRRYVRLVDIAEILGISLSYLEQLVKRLQERAQSPLLEARRGPGGGYRLARGFNSEEMTLGYLYNLLFEREQTLFEAVIASLQGDASQIKLLEVFEEMLRQMAEKEECRTILLRINKILEDSAV